MSPWATCSSCPPAPVIAERATPTALPGRGRVPRRAGGLRPAARGRRCGPSADRSARSAAGRSGRRRGGRALATAAGGEVASGGALERDAALRSSLRVCRGHVAAEEPGPSVKDPEQYEALARAGREHGDGARGSPTPTAARPPRRAAQSGSYDDWTKHDLEKRAAEIGIDGPLEDEQERAASTRCATAEGAAPRAGARRAANGGRSGGAEPQARDLSLPVLRPAPARAERARAGDARR